MFFINFIGSFPGCVPVKAWSASKGGTGLMKGPFGSRKAEGSVKATDTSQVCFCMLTTPALEKLRQENCYKFEASLGYTARSYLETPNQIKQNDNNQNKQKTEQTKRDGKWLALGKAKIASKILYCK